MWWLHRDHTHQTCSTTSDTAWWWVQHSAKSTQCRGRGHTHPELVRQTTAVRRQSCCRAQRWRRMGHAASTFQSQHLQCSGRRREGRLMPRVGTTAEQRRDVMKVHANVWVCVHAILAETVPMQQLHISPTCRAPVEKWASSVSVKLSVSLSRSLSAAETTSARLSVNTT